MKKNCSAIILAAGNSIRMGEDKAFLIFDSVKNTTFIEHIFNVFISFKCKKIIFVLNSKTIEKARKIIPDAVCIENKNPDEGRFHSIKLGTEHALDSEFAFIHNVDNPFVNQNILNKLWEKRNKNAYISPKYENKGGHPILLPKKILTNIQSENTKNQNFRTFLQPFDVIHVLLDEQSILFNINTKENYNNFINLKP